MSKYKYSKTEQQINNVLKYHDEELKKIKTEQPSMSELDSRIHARAGFSSSKPSTITSSSSSSRS